MSNPFLLTFITVGMVIIAGSSALCANSLFHIAWVLGKILIELRASKEEPHAA